MQNNQLYNELTKTQQMYVDSIRSIGNQWNYDLTKSNWTRAELVSISMKRQGNDDVPNWIVKDQSRRVSRGVYAIPELPLEATDDLADVPSPTPPDGDGLPLDLSTTQQQPQQKIVKNKLQNSATGEPY